MFLYDSSTAGRWTPEEHEKFLIGLELYGKNWKKIQDIVKTRNGSQIRSHAQKHFLKLKKTNKNDQDPQSDHISKIVDQPSPIQRSFTQNQASDHSYFMQKIVQYAKYHENFDLWDAFIDDGSHKESPTQIDSHAHQESSQKESYSHPQNMEIQINETTED